MCDNMYYLDVTDHVSNCEFEKMNDEHLIVMINKS